MVQSNLDSAIVSAYLELNTPVDALLSESAKTSSFLTTVRQRLGSGATDDEIKKRLLSLRKKGADKGGLPRLQRAYRGRGPTLTEDIDVE